jgi:hypothetical protein
VSKDDWNALEKHNERQNNVKRWRQSNWRDTALRDATLTKRSSASSDSAAEYQSIIRSLRTQLIVSICFNALLLFTLMS